MFPSQPTPYHHTTQGAWTEDKTLHFNFVQQVSCWYLAISTGVLPLESKPPASAPYTTSSSTCDVCPACAAMCNGHVPLSWKRETSVCQQACEFFQFYFCELCDMTDLLYCTQFTCKGLQGILRHGNTGPRNRTLSVSVTLSHETWVNNDIEFTMMSVAFYAPNGPSDSDICKFFRGDIWTTVSLHGLLRVAWIWCIVSLRSVRVKHLTAQGATMAEENLELSFIWDVWWVTLLRYNRWYIGMRRYPPIQTRHVPGYLPNAMLQIAIRALYCTILYYTVFMREAVSKMN